jgi:hypothetical protein
MVSHPFTRQVRLQVVPSRDDVLISYLALQDSNNDDYTAAIWNSPVPGRV